MTVRETAQALGVTQPRVHAMIRQGDLVAERRRTPFGTVYLELDPEAVERYRVQRQAEAEGTRTRRRPGPRPRSLKA